MNTNSTPHLGASRVIIDSPSALVAATPPALGYVPIGEIVLWLAPRRPRSTTLLASPLSDMVGDWPAEFVANALGSCPESAYLVAWTDASDDTALSDLPTTRAVGEILWHANRQGLAVEQALTTNGRSWWSHICPDLHEWCPDMGTPLNESQSLAVAAEFVASGAQTMPSRQALALLIEPRTQLTSQVSAVWPPSVPPDELEVWRTAEIDWLTSWWSSQMLDGVSSEDPELLARALAALADVRVRDTAMLIMGVWGPRPASQLGRLQPVLTALVRAAPDHALAPPATLLAIVAWLVGDGALASLAVNRALMAAPGYNLASLARILICSDLDPGVWLEGLRDLTEYECRTGRQEPVNRRKRAGRIGQMRRLAG